MLAKKPLSENISAEMPYQTKYLSVLGAKMAYVEAGEGDPILFLHGNPTSKYIWRNVMPHLEGQGRVIAPDLIGMGESDKPNIPYRYQDHYRYLEAFINALGLENITLVIHDWGSALGFNFAYQNQARIKGIAFMEGLVKPFDWAEFPAEYRLPFRLIRTPFVGWLMVNVANIFIKQMLPQNINRDLTKAEMEVYEKPYPTVVSRKPLLQWPREVPFSGSPADTYQIICDYSQWLQQTDMPKLFIYITPGSAINEKTREWVINSFPNLVSHNLGEGTHFLQEDNPHGIGEKISEWQANL
ncbi:MAG: haloalkane dehalogenase [Chloroflexota bacterium]